MIFSVSEAPHYIVALFTGGKTTDMGFVYCNKSKTIRITGLIGILKMPVGQSRPVRDRPLSWNVLLFHL